MPLLMRLWCNLRVRWLPIIGALVLASGLGGCSAVRLGYNNAPSLAYWWLDAYFDFDSAQSLQVRADLKALQDWHRREELPLIREVLKNLQASAGQPVTADQVCALYAYVQTRIQVPAQRFAQSLALVAPTLQPAQLQHMQKTFDKRNSEWREEWLDVSVEERNARRVKQVADRAQSFYGRLDDSQMALLRAFVQASPFDAALHYKETLRRQQDALQVLRELRAGDVPEPEARARVQAMMARAFSPPDPGYVEYLAKLTTQGCAAVAGVHNSSSAQQRAALAQALKDYENDVAALLPP